MPYLLLFLEGIITFISPCLLPMLPLYVSYFTAGEGGRRRTLINALGFVTGFSVVFVILGAFAGTIGGLLIRYSAAVNIVTGLVVIVLGLNFTGIVRIGFLNRSAAASANVKNLRFFSSLLFGLVFSAGWTPCAGAFLGSALMMASNRGGTLQGVLMLLAYSLGLGIPFIAGAMLIDRLKDAFNFIKRNYKVINLVSGIFLIIIGILMAAGIIQKFLFLTVI
ncbi:MAG: cytochrome c biogenesis protein CcdA [Treponema sp.]|nr:cytochrome c biogenesis protein CcdA [Treponema sp.]